VIDQLLSAFLDAVLIPHVLTWEAFGTLITGMGAPYLVQLYHDAKGSWPGKTAKQKRAIKLLSSFVSGFSIAVIVYSGGTEPGPLIMTACTWGIMSIVAGQALHFYISYRLKKLGINQPPKVRIDDEPDRIAVRDDETDETICAMAKQKEDKTP